MLNIFKPWLNAEAIGNLPNKNDTCTLFFCVFKQGKWFTQLNVALCVVPLHHSGVQSTAEMTSLSTICAWLSSSVIWIGTWKRSIRMNSRQHFNNALFQLPPKWYHKANNLATIPTRTGKKHFSVNCVSRPKANLARRIIGSSNSEHWQERSVNGGGRRVP